MNLNLVPGVLRDPDRVNPAHINYRPVEAAYLEEWRSLNEGIGSAPAVLLFPKSTERDRAVSATLIAWLGTPCGAAFLSCAERRADSTYVNFHPNRKIEGLLSSAFSGQADPWETLLGIAEILGVDGPQK